MRLEYLGVVDKFEWRFVRDLKRIAIDQLGVPEKCGIIGSTDLQFRARGNKGVERCLFGLGLSCLVTFALFSVLSVGQHILLN